MNIRDADDEIIYDGKYVQLVRRHYTGVHGKEGVWEMVRRKTYGRIVAMAAITPEKELVLEKIFRIPLNAYSIELPAGLMDKKGESEEEAIRREMLEETGYEVDEVKLLSAGPFNAGLIDDEIAIYLGTNARKAREPELENSEEIEVITVPLERLVDFLSENPEQGVNPALDLVKSGVKIDAKIAAVIPFLERNGLYLNHA